MRSRFIAQLTSGIWMIDPQQAEARFPLVMKYLTGERIDEEEINKKMLPYIIDPQGSVVKLSGSQISYDYISEDDIPEGSTMIVPILDVVSKYNYCGSPGTNTLSAFLKKWDKSAKINGFMFVVDSPGGEADGTRNLSETIANLGKPTVAFIDGMAASAAYWIASAADKIVAALDTDEIGSIGTYVSFADFRDYYEQQGVKLHEVYATKSTNKNKEFKQALDGKYGPLRAQIDVINESFIAGVKQNRKGKMDEDEEEAFTGKLYFADVAKEKGLIDEIGSFETAIESMNDFINVQKSKNENIMKFSLAGMKESAVAFYKSIFGAETEELTAEQVELIAEKAEASAAEVTRLTTELEAVNAEKAELIANTETVAAKVTSLEAAATEKETEITSLKEKMAEMAGQALPDTKIEKNDEIEASDDILKTEEFATSKFANEMMA